MKGDVQDDPNLEAVGLDWQGRPVSLTDPIWFAAKCRYGLEPWAPLNKNAQSYGEVHGPMSWKEAEALCRDLNVIASVMGA